MNQIQRIILEMRKEWEKQNLEKAVARRQASWILGEGKPFQQEQADDFELIPVIPSYPLEIEVENDFGSEEDEGGHYYLSISFHGQEFQVSVSYDQKTIPAEELAELPEGIRDQVQNWWNVEYEQMLELSEPEPF